MKSFFNFLLLLFSSFCAQSQTFTLVADSLRLPNGLEAEGNGDLWLVETGFGLNDGTVSLAKPDGSVLPVIVGLPSAFDTVTGDVVGPWHTLRLPGNKLAVVVGKTPDANSGLVLTFDLTGFMPGSTPPMTAASSTSSLKISDFVLAQPGLTESNPYSLVHDDAGNLYVADAACNCIVKVTASNQMSTFATFPKFPNPTPVGPPFIDPVPTKIISKPGGGFYVATLTGFPFLDGAAIVYSVDANGIVAPYATGMTMLTDLALDANTGDLYTLQFGRFAFDPPPPGFVMGSAQVIRIKTDGTKDTVAQNFGPAAGLELDGHGNLYVSTLFDGLLLKMENVATGVKSLTANLMDFTLAPNPAKSQIHISFTLSTPSKVSLRVLDLAGKTVFSENLGQLSAETYSKQWDTSGQTSGLYFVEIQMANGIFTKKLLIE